MFLFVLFVLFLLKTREGGVGSKVDSKGERFRKEITEY